MSNIVLNSLTYVGSGTINAVSTWWNRTAGLVNAFRQLTARVNYNPTKTVVAWKLTIPVVAEEDHPTVAAGTVLRSTIVDITVRYDRNATATERSDVKEHLDDLVASTQFVSSITDLVLPE